MAGGIQAYSIEQRLRITCLHVLLLFAPFSCGAPATPDLMHMLMRIITQLDIKEGEE